MSRQRKANTKATPKQDPARTFSAASTSPASGRSTTRVTWNTPLFYAIILSLGFSLYQFWQGQSAARAYQEECGVRLEVPSAPGFNEAVISQLGWRPPKLSEERLFEVVDLPGRGKGIVALQDIEMGSLILHESPVLVVPRSLNVDPVSFVAHQISTLSEAEREAFYGLSYVPADAPDVSPAIISTNAVAVGNGGIGVFPTMARLNHGCAGAFNVVYSFREATGEIVVHALRNITKGEELLTTYTDTKRPRHERQAYLSSQYGFECSCAVCSLPPSQSEHSDKQLTKMSTLYGELAAWGAAELSGSQALRLVRAIWALGEQEGYHSERGQLAADAVTVAPSHSDGEAAREWAAEAMRWFAVELGEEHPRVREMQKVFVCPKRSGVWGTRQTERVGGVH
ncbi:SET domain-containing protein [Cylindrobasidium torrendii FP15055 ss-10]|uniref:SET domain-containing protein n=1 Tax=Cylindrobasidium torrendii FP15055 ss-10 TaxID=1314674 RepID=A0A0D7AU48_9AGAR|nr:SET domain-containing protein [Cylindrobasidium torrendii FP15055 ss-10]